MDNLYTVTSLADDVYNISENISETVSISQQLIVGTTRAVLIDTGLGIDDGLKKVIRKITDKQIVVLLTNGDADHIGGASAFKGVFMHPTDAELMKQNATTETRLNTVATVSDHNKELVDYMKTNMLAADSFEYMQIHDGDALELGGAVLRAVGLPGHSKGSLAYVDADRHMAFTGDGLASGSMSIIFGENSASLSDWKQGLSHLKEVLGNHDDNKLYSTHQPQAFSDDILAILGKGIYEIEAGKAQADKPVTQLPTKPVQATETSQPMAHQCGNSQYVIMYNALNL